MLDVVLALGSCIEGIVFMYFTDDLSQYTLMEDCQYTIANKYNITICIIYHNKTSRHYFLFIVCLYKDVASCLVTPIDPDKMDIIACNSQDIKF